MNKAAKKGDKTTRFHWIHILFAFFISACILTLIFTRIDAEKVFTVIRRSDLRLVLLAAIVSLSVNLFLGTEKWRRILSNLGCSLPYKEAFLVRTGCIPFKVILPMKSSELLKALYLKRQRGFSFARGISSLLLDKTLNLLVTLCIFLTGLSWVGVRFPYVIPFSLLLLLCSAAILFSPSLRKMIFAVSGKVHPKAHAITVQLLSGFEEIQTKEKGILLLYSLLYQLSEFLNTYLIFRAVGIAAPFSLILVYIPLIMIINNAPITVLGIGTREALIVFLFARYGAAASLLGGALLVSFIEHILPVIAGILFIKYLIGYFSVREMVSVKERVGSESHPN